MSKVFISVSDTMDRLVKQVDNMGNKVIARGADKILGSFGSEARKIIGHEQESTFDMGATQTKFNGKRMREKTSFRSQKHGWFLGEDGTKIIGFGYESTAYKKYWNKKGYRTNATSVGYVYSLLDNLWGSPVTYKKNSIAFHSSNYEGKGYWGSYRAGTIRDAKETHFDESKISEAIAPTLVRAERDLKQLLVEEGF